MSVCRFLSLPYFFSCFFFFFSLLQGYQAGLWWIQQQCLQSQKVLLENIMVMLSAKCCLSLKKRKNHCEENKKVAQRQECSLQEKRFFTPSANVFPTQKQDGFKQQNSHGEQSPGLNTGNGLVKWESKIIVFITFPFARQGCFKRKHASMVKEQIFGANFELVFKINI